MIGGLLPSGKFGSANAIGFMRTGIAKVEMVIWAPVSRAQKKKL
jgi:hypothetical protein